MSSLQLSNPEEAGHNESIPLLTMATSSGTREATTMKHISRKDAMR